MLRSMNDLEDYSIRATVSLDMQTELLQATEWTFKRGT
jgi:hypothetical protein